MTLVENENEIGKGRKFPQHIALSSLQTSIKNSNRVRDINNFNYYSHNTYVNYIFFKASFYLEQFESKWTTSSEMTWRKILQLRKNVFFFVKVVDNFFYLKIFHFKNSLTRCTCFLHFHPTPLPPSGRWCQRFRHAKKFMMNLSLGEHSFFPPSHSFDRTYYVVHLCRVAWGLDSVEWEIGGKERQIYHF